LKLLLRFPELRFEAVASEAPPPGNVPLEKWQPAAGETSNPVIGWHSAGRLHFQFPGFARYVFDPVGDYCEVAAFAGASNAQLIDAYQRAVLPIILQSRGTEVLHASAVDTNAGVLVFAAFSGTGKSTLAAELREHGYAVWADDAVAWTAHRDGIISAALPFVLRVGNSAKYLPLATRASGVERPLAAIIVMERSSARDPLLTRIAPSSAALSAVLPHAYCFSMRDRMANRSLIANHLALVAALPVYRLAFPPRREVLSATIALLEATLQLRPRREFEATAAA
jgi:hypothetical protein